MTRKDSRNGAIQTTRSRMDWAADAMLSCKGVVAMRHSENTRVDRFSERFWDK